MSKLDLAIKKIDETNAQDPQKDIFEGEEFPKEMLYGQRMSAWLAKVEPNASEALKLAARAQHIRRWEIPRSNYPMDRVGYLKWRTTLYSYHADKAAEVLIEVGYDEDVVNRVKSLLQKKNLKTDVEMQTLENVICLVFLENYFSDFSKQYDEEKMIDIVRKTWKKMSERGHELALTIHMPEPAKCLVEKALNHL